MCPASEPIFPNAQIRPHPHFMLFATQNPPGAYGGRKARGQQTCIQAPFRSPAQSAADEKPFMSIL